jgi:hypothetical protein
MTEPWLGESWDRTREPIQEAWSAAARAAAIEARKSHGYKKGDVLHGKAGGFYKVTDMTDRHLQVQQLRHSPGQTKVEPGMGVLGSVHQIEHSQAKDLLPRKVEVQKGGPPTASKTNLMGGVYVRDSWGKGHVAGKKSKG